MTPSARLSLFEATNSQPRTDLLIATLTPGPPGVFHVPIPRPQHRPVRYFTGQYILTQPVGGGLLITRFISGQEKGGSFLPPWRYD